MTDMNKINPEELEGVAGGANEGGAWKTVAGLTGGYLAIRTAPAVQVTGGTVMGTTFGGGRAAYTWVYAPKYGVSGYVNSAFIK